MALRPSTKEDFLRIWRDVLPPGYTLPIEEEAEGAGFDVPSLAAAIFEAFERDLNVSQQAYFLRRHSIQTGDVARGGAKARTTLQLYRAAPALGDLLVREGTAFPAQVSDSLGGRLTLGRFLAVADTVLPSGAGGPIAVEVEAEFEGYAGNVWEGTITTFEAQGRLSVAALVTATNELRSSPPLSGETSDRFHLGLVGRMVRLVPLAPLATPDALLSRRVIGAYEASGDVVVRFEPPLVPADVLAAVSVEVEEVVDLGVSVQQPNPAVGGRVDGLSAVGAERRAERSPNMTDDEYAEALTELPDTVSPGALERTAKRVLEPWGVPWCLHETGEPDGLMGFTWDLHPWDFGSACGCGETVPPGSEYVGSGLVWLNDAQHVRFFVVCVGRRNVDEAGAAWDATNQAGDFPNAWDAFAWDAGDYAFDSLVGRLWDELDRVRMAGVKFAIVLDDSL